MNEQNNPIRPPHDFDLDPTVRAEELASLGVELQDGLITADRLKRWAADIDVRTGLLAYTVWGSIRWHKSIGRPHTPSLNSGFIIEHTYYKEDWVFVGPGKIVDRGLWLDLPEPAKWDGPDDPEYHIVSFMTRAEGYFQNRIAAKFAPGVGWERPEGILPVRGPRHIQPLSYGFRTFGDFVHLDPFEVFVKPIIPWYIEAGIEP